MFRTILAVSEGGLDAAATFGLAKRVASLFGAAVDALYVPDKSGRGVLGISPRAHADALKSHAKECERWYREILAGTANNTYTAETALPPLEALRVMGRRSDLLVAGRPGDPPNLAPDSVRVAIHDCARAVLVAPPKPSVGPFRSVIVAWNGSVQAARAIHFAMPLLAKADRITILVAGRKPGEVRTDLLMRNLDRRHLRATIDALDPGSVSSRARGRALLAYTHDAEADLLVMGAYGGGRLATFLGVGGATGKVISSCRVPVLVAN
ncbi:MAG TPA: universal stress protein [Reyranella sp.]|jgi:nucleotide-binding universal stress UspA family protein